MNAPVSVEIPCARCGKIAATFTAIAAGDGAPTVLQDRDRLVRTGWSGELTIPCSWEIAVLKIERLRAGGIAALQNEDRDTYAFRCLACARSYCSSCWTQGPPQFDDGFYDCTYGWCPEGHKQMIDD